jgi:beta-lactamase superfamily II metal-dependent hydrolase
MKNLGRILVGLAVVSAVLVGGAEALEIHCLDVGQGDCTLIVSPTGGTLLFDAGRNGQGNTTVLPYLQGLGITALDYMSSSHYHMDHIGGLDDVVYGLGIDSIRVSVLDRGWSYTTLTYQDYADAVAPKRTTISDGQVIDLGGGVTVTCIGVNGNGQLSPPYDDSYNENDLCISLLVQWCDFDFFVAGDLSGVNSSYYNDIETSVAAEVGDVDVYRVDHHGSASNSNNALVSTLLPEVSIISVGNNSYGHPTQTVIDRLVSYGSFIYQTELGDGGTIPSGEGEVVNGHIVIEVSAGQYTVDGDVYPLGSSGVDITPARDLLAVYPNPFRETAVIELSGPAAGAAAVAIYDVEGRLVRNLGSTGRFVTWDGCSPSGAQVAPGVYFVRMSGRGAATSRTLIKR